MAATMRSIPGRYATSNDMIVFEDDTHEWTFCPGVVVCRSKHRTPDSEPHNEQMRRNREFNPRKWR